MNWERRVGSQGYTGKEHEKVLPEYISRTQLGKKSDKTSGPETTNELSSGLAGP